MGIRKIRVISVPLTREHTDNADLTDICEEETSVNHNYFTAHLFGYGHINYNMKNKNLLLILGFVLFLFGALSVIVGLVGVQLVPTAWMTDLFGGTAAFIIQLFMAMFGIALAIVSRTEDDAFDEHFDGHKFRDKSSKTK